MSKSKPVRWKSIESKS